MPAIIERVLNHLSGEQGGLKSVYQRYDYFPERKAALEAWGSLVQKLTNTAEGYSSGSSACCITPETEAKPISPAVSEFVATTAR